MNKELILRFIHNLDGYKRVAKLCNISIQAVYLWKDNGDIPDIYKGILSRAVKREQDAKVQALLLADFNEIFGEKQWRNL